MESKTRREKRGSREGTRRDRRNKRAKTNQREHMDKMTALYSKQKLGEGKRNSKAGEV